jgi:hypothetical protein
MKQIHEKGAVQDTWEPSVDRRCGNGRVESGLLDLLGAAVAVHFQL